MALRSRCDFNRGVVDPKSLSRHLLSQSGAALNPEYTRLIPLAQAEISIALIGGVLHNQREHLRVPIRAQVTCIADTGTLRGVTRNISQGGIQVETPELRRRAHVQLTFRLPHSDTIIEALGAVVWISGKRNGIKFKQVGMQSQELIRHYIEEHTKLS